MTVKELRILIKRLPDDMEVFMPMDDDSLVTVCKEKSEVIDIDISDEFDENHDTIPVLLLLPCGCHEELEQGEINSQPELN